MSQLYDKFTAFYFYDQEYDDNVQLQLATASPSPHFLWSACIIIESEFNCMRFNFSCFAIVGRSVGRFGIKTKFVRYTQITATATLNWASFLFECGKSRSSSRWAVRVKERPLATAGLARWQPTGPLTTTKQRGGRGRVLYWRQPLMSSSDCT